MISTVKLTVTVTGIIIPSLKLIGQFKHIIEVTYYLFFCITDPFVYAFTRAFVDYEILYDLYNYCIPLKSQNII